MRILIVDESEPIRNLLRRKIERRKTFTIVGEACNGADAVVVTERLNPDVVILETDMPVMDGEEAARLIKRARPEVRIIAYTSSMGSRVKNLLNDGTILGCVDKLATDDLFHRLDGLARDSQQHSRRRPIT